MTFADNLKAIEDTYGITAEYIAKKAGLCKGSGSRFRSGKNIPSIETVSKIINACPVPWIWDINGMKIYGAPKEE